MIVVIQCSERKRPTAQVAETLYDSQLFRCQVKWAKSTGLQWVIFSAFYGIVRPDQIVEPYDVTLGSPLCVCSNTLRSQITDKIIITTVGERYAKLLEKAGAELTQPLKGLGVGQRKNWLLNNLGRLA